MNLSQLTCIPCKVGAPTLTSGQIDQFTPQLNPDWQVIDNHHLTRQFEFADFKTAIAFVDRVADLAESQGHHPNIHITNWNRVNLDLYTHKINGLHQNDFILASKIDQL